MKFETNKLYRHRRSMDVDYCCHEVVASLPHCTTVFMVPVHRRFGPYEIKYGTYSIISKDEAEDNWALAPKDAKWI